MMESDCEHQPLLHHPGRGMGQRDSTTSLLHQASRSLEAAQGSCLAQQSSVLVDEDEKDLGCCTPLTPVRRMFCLLALFDFLFLFLMWIIYAQLFGKGIKVAFAMEVKNYMFRSSLFDFVLCALVRTVVLLIVYAGIRSDKWYTVAITTASSTVLAIIKVLLYGEEIFQKGQPMSYLIVIATFILCWSELWHFDFQVIPHEIKSKIRSSTLTGSLPAVVGDTNYWRQQRARSEYQSFYTPYTRTYKGSSSSTLSDDFGDISEDAQEERAKDKAFVRHSKDAMRQTLRMFHINEGWKVEKEEADGIEISSRQFDNIGKVFRCQATIDCPSKVMFKLMWEDVDSQPAWNPTVAECQIIRRVNRKTDIVYVVANDAAGGLISSRDFVTLRRSKRKGPFYICAGIATKYDMIPEKKNMVRGENGPGGYIMRSISDDPNKTEFTWLLNTNLKGWIPQSLIDQSMNGVIIDTIKALRHHISTLPR